MLPKWYKNPFCCLGIPLEGFTDSNKHYIEQVIGHRYLFIRPSDVVIAEND